MFVSASFFEAESGCKGKTFFRTFQIFFKKKLQKFPRLFQSGKWYKDNSFSHPLQIFRKIFSNELFREPRCLSEYVSFSDCGCKDKYSVGYFQTFSKLFSILIFILPSHRYPTSSYDFPFPAEIFIYNKVRVYRPIPKQNRRCMFACSDGLRFYIRTAGTPTLFPESGGQTHA